MGTECEDICIPYECLPKEDFNNQVNRMACSLAVSLFFWSLLLLPSGLMNKWSWNEDGGYAGLSNMNFHYPGPIWI